MIGETLSQIAPKNEGEVKDEQGDSNVVCDRRPRRRGKELIRSPE